MRRVRHCGIAHMIDGGIWMCEDIHSLEADVSLEEITGEAAEGFTHPVYLERKLKNPTSGNDFQHVILYVNQEHRESDIWVFSEPLLYEKKVRRNYTTKEPVRVVDIDHMQQLNKGCHIFPMTGKYLVICLMMSKLEWCDETFWIVGIEKPDYGLTGIKPLTLKVGKSHAVINKQQLMEMLEHTNYLEIEHDSGWSISIDLNEEGAVTDNDEEEVL